MPPQCPTLFGVKSVFNILMTFNAVHELFPCLLRAGLLTLEDRLRRQHHSHVRQGAKTLQ